MLNNRRWLVAASLVGNLLCWATGPVCAEEAPPKAAPKAEAKSGGRFVRLERDQDDELLSMQTAIVSFSKPDEKDGPQVDLIGAVHVGEKAYYDALNKAFEDYDVVLYELVAPEGTQIPKGQKANNSHVAGAVQNGMKGVLNLEHQLEMIDYTQENMVHADMSPDQFSKSMSDRGESFMGMMFRMMGQGMAQQAKMQAKGKLSHETNLLAALFDSNRPLAMKRAMAEQFEDVESAMGAFNGKDGSTIITERNKVALKKMADALQAGKKKIAIFYGAGHMPHMEECLIGEYGMKRTGERWLTAWELAKEPAATAK